MAMEDYMKNPPQDGEKVMILRHDVDASPQNSLRIAQLQHDFGVRGSYYFRIVSQSFQPDYIKGIRNLGHEIGYHYEELTLSKGDYEDAILNFKHNLETVRAYYPVKTICMHGSPMSKFDNRLIWEKYNYRDYGIIGEPYFDLDFNKMLYITDTGRSWNKTRASIRDSVESPFNYHFSSTFDIIRALHKKELPDQIMQNIHPQRWHDNLFRWNYEFISQNIKNQAKIVLKRFRK
jgi:hypothetical protein